MKRICPFMIQRVVWSSMVFLTGFIVAPPVHAVEFDLIYPVEAKVSTPANSVAHGLYLGLIVATTQTITVEDLQNATCSAAIDDPLVTLECIAVLNPQWGPLETGEALGISSGSSAPYLTLLGPEESVVANVPGLQVDFAYGSDPGHDGDANLTVTLSMGPHQVAFDTLVHFGDDPDEIVVVGRRSASDQNALGLLNELLLRVLELNLNQGIENSLDAKLASAIRSLDDLNQQNDTSAVNSLQAMINEVEAQRSNKITDGQADELIDRAQAIIGLLVQN